MISLKAYQSGETLHANPRWKMMKGMRLKDGAPVLIKTLASDHPANSDLKRFQHDFEIGSSLQHDHIISYLDFIPSAEGFAIVTEDFNSQTLDQLVQQSPFLLDTFLSFSLQIVSALDCMHRQKIVHSDITSAAILFNPTENLAKIVDFSLSYRLNWEADFDASPYDINGSLAFISPEQTGRINRPVDHRSDFYSLGVTFYYLLTGQLPFEHADPMRLIHAHIAQYPVAPSQLNDTIPPTLSDLIMKLMSKDVEDRYQSTSGLMTDLETCRRQYTSSRSIGSFELGKQDLSPRLRLSRNVYGRDEDLVNIAKAFDSLDQIKKHVLFVSGITGIGKSHFLKEIRRALSLKRARIINGNYETTQSAIPFLGIVQALRQGVKIILTESDQELEVWRQRLVSALGPNIQVIADLIPELTLIARQETFSVKMATEEIRNRFPHAVLELVKQLCQPTMPLVLIIDNLHLADAASFRLLDAILTDSSLSQLMCIAAFSSEPGEATATVHEFINAVKKENKSVQQMEIERLDTPQVTSFILDSFRCKPKKARELASVIIPKTAGNPYFIRRFLTQMHQEKKIWWQSSDQEKKQNWVFDIKSIEMQNATDNVIDFLESKLADLNAEVKEALATAACIGMEFDMEILGSVLNKSEQTLAPDLLLLVQNGILSAVDPGSMNYGIVYRFSHPRLQKAMAAYEDESSRCKIHYQIGQYLWTKQAQSLTTESLFRTVTHLNKGRKLISSQREREKLIRLNLQAGIKAKQANITESAISFFETGLELLNDTRPSASSETLLSLRYELADTLYMIGAFKRMEQVIRQILACNLNQRNQVMVWGLRISALIARNMMTEALELGLDSLKKIGIRFPVDPGQDRVIWEFAHTKWALTGKNLEGLKRLPGITDKKKILIVKLVRQILMPAFVVKPRLFAVIILKMMRYTLKWGISEECIFFTYYGFILCGIQRNFEAGYRFGRLGTQMTDRFPNCKNRAPNTHVFEALIRLWKEPVKNSLPGLLEGYRQSLETGDMEIAANSLYAHGICRFHSGDFLEDVEKSMENQFQRIRRYQHQSAVNIGSFYLQTVSNLRGKADSPCELNNPCFNEREGVVHCNQNNDTIGLTHYYNCKVLLLFLFGNYSSAIESVRTFKPRMDRTIGFVSHVLIHFYYALSMLAIFHQQSNHRKKQFLKEIKEIIAWFKPLAAACNANYLNKYCLLQAELCRINRSDNAPQYYRQAIDLAGKNGFVQEQAIANECFASYWSARQEPKISELFVIEAYELYRRWGATAKTSAMEAQYPNLSRHQTDSSPSALKGDPSLTPLTSTRQVDFQATLAAVREVSGEIITKRLLSSILKLIIEHSGAEIGFLITKKDRNMVINEAATLKNNGIVSVYEPVLNSSHDRFCHAIVSFVFRSGETILFDNTHQHSPFANDPYIRKNGTKSLLCAPFQLRNYTYGVIYLENNLAEAVFTQNRVEFIRTILAQASVSMENARLYEKTISTQKKLIKSEEKYKILVENTGAMVIHLSLGSIILFINSPGADFFNAEPFELIGKSACELSEFFQLTLKDRILNLSQSGRGATFEDCIDLPAGDFWFISNYQPVKDDRGDIIAIQVTAQNISEYKAAEEELKRLSTILEATSDFVSICLPNMNVQYINSAGKRMIGLDDAVNLVNLELEQFHPKWAMRIVRNEGIPGAINHGTWSGETALLHANGKEIPTSQVIMAHISESGKLQFISTIARDISVQKENEERLKQYQEKLENMVSKQTSELKVVQGQLIEKAHKAGVAEIAAGTLHNVGNLLNSIKTSANAIDSVIAHSTLTGFVQANQLLKQNMANLAQFVSRGAKGETLMQYYLKLEESLVKEGTSIQNEIKRLNEKIDIISDVITAQQTYAGSESLTEEYSLVTIVEDALTLEAGLIDRYGISVIRHYEEIPMVPIQKTKLIHVLINLINNARDAMLHLPVEERIITFTIKKQRSNVLLSTKDSGRGIIKEHMEKIFTHGFTTKKGGHGFGLHSSASFIAEMNGKMWFESEGEGKGATFIIRLPLANKGLTE